MSISRQFRECRNGNSISPQLEKHCELRRETCECRSRDSRFVKSTPWSEKILTKSFNRLSDILTDSQLLLPEHIKKRLSRPRSWQPQQNVWQKTADDYNTASSLPPPCRRIQSKTRTLSLIRAMQMCRDDKRNTRIPFEVRRCIGFHSMMYPQKCDCR